MARDHGPGIQDRGPPRVTDVKVDIDDGPSVELTKDGYRAVRIARVFGVPGDGAVRLFHALNAKRVPKYGDLHPVIAGLPVSRVHAALESGSTDIATVTCEYFYPTGGNMHFANIEDVRNAGLPQLEIISTVQPATTQFYLDDAGNKHQILLPYTRTDPETQTSTELPLQSGTVEYQLPMTVFRYMRRERTPVDMIRSTARQYVGAINSIAIFGEVGIHYWMCTRLDGVSDDAGQTSNVTYEFQRHPETWNPVAIYVDPDTQLPVTDTETLPPGLIDGKRIGGAPGGIGRFRIYDTLDFNQLNLTI